MIAPAIPPAILPRIGSLLRLLGSDHDHEALGAVRALRRTLSGAGVDLHTLADAVERPAPMLVFRERPEPASQAKKGRRAPPGDIDIGYAQRRDVTDALRRALGGDRLSEWETEFATSILVRLQGGHGRLTKKQGDALNRLLHRLGEGAAWA